MSTIWSFLSSRRFQARIFSTMFCAILVVLRPFSHLGGPSAYLAITIKELVFSPQENLPQQIEATFLHLVGGLFGIAVSILGNFLASLAYDRVGDIALSRCIPALTLAVICFTAGWLKSRLPRLALASRIACFVSIWLLTSGVGPQPRIHEHAVQFVWMTVTAAVTSVFSCMILLTWSSTQFAVEMAKALSELRSCLNSSLGMPSTEKADEDIRHLTHVAPTDLLKRCISLDTLYQQATFELRIGRVGVKSLKPMIITIEHLRLILSRRLGFPRFSSDSPEVTSILEVFHGPALELGTTVLECMDVIESEVLVCYDNSTQCMRENKPDIIALQARLTKTMNIVRGHLQETCENLEARKRMLPSDTEFPGKVIDSCTCVVHLLQVAQEIQFGLRIAQEMRVCYDESRPRLWHPRFSIAWLGVTPTMVSTDEGSTFLDAGHTEEAALLSEREMLQGIAEYTHDTSQGDDYMSLITRRPRLTGRPFSFRWFRSLFYLVWNHPRTLRARLRLSKAMKALEQSPHLRHALKNAAGVALLSLPAFLPSDTPAYRWFTSSYGQWMIISYVWVLETNTGATFRVAYLRLCGTISGAIYAYIASLFCGSNPYALVAMMTLAEIPISWVVINTTFFPMGTVAAVTLPPVLFTPYFHPYEQIFTWRLALLRSALISAGVIGALLVNSLFFPRHCRVLFLDKVCQTLGICSQLFMNMSRDLFHHAHTSAVHKKRSYKLERDIRNSLHRLAVLLKTMNDEASLVPKPMRRYRQILDILHRLSSLLTTLRKVGQHIPKREVVAAVAPQRRELVSCICISLFAIEQGFRARQPLPQFLPSSRIAFISMEQEVEEQLLESGQGQHESLGLPLIYVFAEMDLLAELVDTIDELVELTRHLFGTSSWLNQVHQTPMQTPTMASAHDLRRD